MTPEAQRIAIAEACGWSDPHWECPHCGRVEPTHVTYEERHGVEGCLQFVHWVELPDYLTDLNAMHEAWKVLTEPQRRTFASKLYDLANGFRADDDDGWTPDIFEASMDGVALMVHATAAQRAEAFLRTLGLWKDGA